MTEVIVDSYDYFQPELVQSAILSERTLTIGPSSQIDAIQGQALGELNFTIPSTSNLYYDLSDTKLWLNLKIVKADGTVLDDDQAVAPTNNFLHSLFSSCEVKVCGKDVNDTSTVYPYRAMFETILNYTKDAMDFGGKTQLFVKDDAGRMDNITMTPQQGQPDPNSGFVARAKIAKKSRAFVVEGPLHIDLANQNKEIPTQCEINIRLTPTNAAFALMEAADGTCKILVLGAKLFVKAKEIAADLILVHKQMLEKKNMGFPMNRVTIKRNSIIPGSRSANVVLNFPSRLPKRIFIAFAENAAVVGNRAKNPYNFQNFDISSIQLDVNGKRNPSEAVRIDFDNGTYEQQFVNLMDVLDPTARQRGLVFTYDDYPMGYTIFGFKVAPGPIDSNVQTIADSVGQITVNVEFSQALPANTEMITYCETSARMEIDKLNAVTML